MAQLAKRAYQLWEGTNEAESVLVLSFMNALDQGTRSLVVAGGIGSFDEVVSRAKRIEGASMVEQKTEHAVTSEVTKKIVSELVQKECGRHETKIQTRFQDVRKRKCWYCGAMGHTQRFCKRRMSDTIEVEQSPSMLPESEQLI